MKFWKTLGQVVIGTVAGYGIDRIENPKASWVNYREQLLEQTSQIALGYLMEKRIDGTKKS
ncbi:hypothetical protein [Selenomonas sp. AE3005]|uniref:hypothetical protein n=1 Tax=Selenomonas sp. AE3005 TaxID=1485543 RepID=UPI00047FBB8E|nr:hypothetical protein [Selenomonas sp. AE3005]